MAGSTIGRQVVSYRSVRASPVERSSGSPPPLQASALRPIQARLLTPHAVERGSSAATVATADTATANDVGAAALAFTIPRTRCARIMPPRERLRLRYPACLCRAVPLPPSGHRTVARRAAATMPARCYFVGDLRHRSVASVSDARRIAVRTGEQRTPLPRQRRRRQHARTDLVRAPGRTRSPHSVNG
jgi:hypothetical protein